MRTSFFATLIGLVLIQSSTRACEPDPEQTQPQRRAAVAALALLQTDASRDEETLRKAIETLAETGHKAEAARLEAYRARVVPARPREMRVGTDIPRLGRLFLDRSAELTAKELRFVGVDGRSLTVLRPHEEERTRYEAQLAERQALLRQSERSARMFAKSLEVVADGARAALAEGEYAKAADLARRAATAERSIAAAQQRIAELKREIARLQAATAGVAARLALQSAALLKPGKPGSLEDRLTRIEQRLDEIAALLSQRGRAR